MHARSCQEDTSPNNHLKERCDWEWSTDMYFELRCIKSQIGQKAKLWDKPLHNYLYFFTAAEKTTTKTIPRCILRILRKKSQNSECILGIPKGGGSAMWTVNSEFQEKSQNSEKNVRTVDVKMRFQGEKIILIKNYSKKKCKILRWQESNWIARRKSQDS